MRLPAGAEEGLAGEAGGAAEERGGRGSDGFVFVTFVVVVIFAFIATAITFVAVSTVALRGRLRGRRLAHQPPRGQENGVPGPQLGPHDALQRLYQGHGPSGGAASPGRKCRRVGRR